MNVAVLVGVAETLTQTPSGNGIDCTWDLTQGVFFASSPAKTWSASHGIQFIDPRPSPGLHRGASARTLSTATKQVLHGSVHHGTPSTRGPSPSRESPQDFQPRKSLGTLNKPVDKMAGNSGGARTIGGQGVGGYPELSLSREDDPPGIQVRELRSWYRLSSIRPSRPYAFTARGCSGARICSR